MNEENKEEFYTEEDLAKDVKVPTHRVSEIFRKRKYGIVELCDDEDGISINGHPIVDDFIPNIQTCEAFSVFQAANTLTTDVLNMIDRKVYENFDYDVWWINNYSSEYKLSEVKTDMSGNQYIEVYIAFVGEDENGLCTYELEMQMIVFQI